LLVSTSTTTTTPSSEGMSVEIRTSCDSPQACVTEAILSTTTLLMPLTMSGLLSRATGHPWRPAPRPGHPVRALVACDEPSAPVKYARQGDDLGEAERVRGR